MMALILRRRRARRRGARLRPHAAPLPQGLARAGSRVVTRLAATVARWHAAGSAPVRRAGLPGRRGTPARAAPTGARRCGRPRTGSRSGCRSVARSPETVVAHLGPTNSGKTHDALAFLAEHGRGVYAGAAADARAGGAPPALGAARRRAGRPRDRRGARQRPRPDPLLHRRDGAGVGRRARARRGAVGRRRGARRGVDATPARAASTGISGCSGPSTPCRSSAMRSRTRSSASSSGSCRSSSSARAQLRALTPGTVVVAFSRRAVLALAGEVNRLHPDRVAVLYGAMPLASRREEIDRFLHGAADVCVATDVLGHGVNLPCETLLFAETTKFDGESAATCCRGRSRRSPAAPAASASSSAATSASSSACRGRCRSGESSSGARAARRAPGGASAATASSTRRASGRGSATSASTIRASSTRRSRRGVASRPGMGARELARGRVVAPIRGRLAIVVRHLRERGRRLGLEETWQLVNAPVDEGARAARRARARRRRRPCPAAAPPVPPRHVPAPRRHAGGGRGGGARRRDPALVRAAVPGRRGRHDRARRRARAGGGGTGCAASRSRGARRSDRALPLVREELPAVVPTLRALRAVRTPLRLSGAASPPPS